MLDSYHHVVTNILLHREDVVLFTRGELVDGREGGGFAREPLHGAVAKDVVCGGKLIVFAEAVADDIRAEHNHATGPDVVCRGAAGAVDVAVLERGQNGALIAEGNIDLLSKADPEGCLTQAAGDRGALLRGDEGVRTEQVAMLLRSGVTGHGDFQFFNVPEDDGGSQQVFVEEGGMVVQHRNEVLQAFLYVLVGNQVITLSHAAQVSRG